MTSRNVNFQLLRGQRRARSNVDVMRREKQQHICYRRVSLPQQHTHTLTNQIDETQQININVCNTQ
jgi:predicted site-specific integrase-resolvase